jgi:hypothetical protein
MGAGVVKKIVDLTILSLLVTAIGATGHYPLELTLEATAGNTTTRITSSVTIRIDRLMEENRRKRVTDALTYSGYGNFMTALRALPPVGTITLSGRSVELRYAREDAETDGQRLVLVADRPLFFLGNDQAKPKAGYELTLVELHIDAQGVVTGRMAGAARVKPSPSGVVLDDFAETPVALAGRVAAR